MSIVHDTLTFSPDGVNFAFEYDWRYCFDLPPMFVLDYVNNPYPIPGNTYSLRFYTLPSTGTQDEIAPHIVWSSFVNGSVISERPLNPTLRFQFNEEVELNPT